MAERGTLEKPWNRVPLMRALAVGEKTQVQLAAEYGATQGAVSQFAARHADEIAALRGKLDDEWAGLWVADKARRLAVYQDDIEALHEIASKAGEDGEAASMDEKLATLKVKILRQVAEEMGHLRADVNLTGKVLHHVIEGVDLADLE